MDRDFDFFIFCVLFILGSTSFALLVVNSDMKDKIKTICLIAEIKEYAIRECQ